MLNITDVDGLENTWIASAGPGSFTLGQKWLENVYTAYDSKYLSFSFIFFSSSLFFLLVENHRTLAYALSAKHQFNPFVIGVGFAPCRA